MSKPKKLTAIREFPLEEIVIGSTFAPDFFDDVKITNGDGLQKIA